MNLISNCCISGYIYQFLNKQFMNPFQWCFIEPRDLIYLMTHYNRIDFNKYKLIKSIEHPNSYVLELNEYCRLKFIHYIEDKNEDFKMCNHNIKSKNIIEYINKKWKERLSRMKEPPVFLYLARTHKHSPNINTDFIKIESKFKRILICNDKELLKYNSKNILVIYDENPPQTDKNRPYDFAQRYYQKINQFINSHN